MAGVDGGPMTSHAWHRPMTAAVKAAGFAGVRYHDLRHHAASRLIASGLSVVAVARFLRHDDPTTTLQVYGHLWADDNDRIRSAMASAWGAAESRTDHDEDAVRGFAQVSDHVVTLGRLPRQGPRGRVTRAPWWRDTSRLTETSRQWCWP